MRRHIAGTTTFLLLVAAVGLAQRGTDPGPAATLTGTVTDAGTGQPLGGAQVRVVDARRGAPRTVTGSDGRYSLPLSPSRYPAGREVRIAVQLLGYAPEERTVVPGTEVARVDFSLRPAAMETEALVVTEAVTLGARRRRARVEMSAPGVAPEVAPTAATFAAPPPPTDAGTAVHHGRGGRVRDTEAYDRIWENPFLAVEHTPLSTFSIDVDRASYANVRRYLRDGVRPPADAVRIEEMVNYFSYRYPEPRGEHPFSVTTEVAPAPWNARHQLVRIGLQGRSIETAALPPSNLVFLIDVSGSMSTPDRLPLLKSAFHLLIDQLREQDQVAIVVYAGAAGLVLPPTPGNEKRRIRDAIDRLEAGGSTAGGEGIRLAYDVARRSHLPNGNNRVILATDGDFNVGVSSDGEMVRLIEEKREQGTYLTVLGFGRGNLKDSKMEKLSGHGNGTYAYVDDLQEARKVFVEEMGGTLLTIAKDVKLQVEFNPEAVQAYRLIGYENRLLRDEDFNDDARDAGDMGAGHSVTALYEVIPAGIEPDVRVRGVDSLRYQRPRPSTRSSTGGELAYVKIRYKRPDGGASRLLSHPVRARSGAPSQDFDFAAAVAGLGLLLRDSEYRGTLRIDDVVALARRSQGRDEDGYRAEFVQMAESARRLGLLEGEERVGRRYP